MRSHSRWCRSLLLDVRGAGEFLEVYQGVLPGGEVSAMVKELVSGGALPLPLVWQRPSPAAVAARGRCPWNERAAGVPRQAGECTRLSTVHSALLPGRPFPCGGGGALPGG